MRRPDYYTKSPDSWSGTAKAFVAILVGLAILGLGKVNYDNKYRKWKDDLRMTEVVVNKVEDSRNGNYTIELGLNDGTTETADFTTNSEPLTTLERKPIVLNLLNDAQKEKVKIYCWIGAWGGTQRIYECWHTARGQ